jgi:hypothetical protein
VCLGLPTGLSGGNATPNQQMIQVPRWIRRPCRVAWSQIASSYRSLDEEGRWAEEGEQCGQATFYTLHRCVWCRPVSYQL